MRKAIYLALIALGVAGVTSAAVVSSGGDEASSGCPGHRNVKASYSQTTQHHSGCSMHECSGKCPHMSER
jgi:hypothetical protein